MPVSASGAGAAAVGLGSGAAAAGAGAVVAAPLGGRVNGLPSTSSGKSATNTGSCAFHATDAARSRCFSASVVSTAPAASVGLDLESSGLVVTRHSARGQGRAVARRSRDRVNQRTRGRVLQHERQHAVQDCCDRPSWHPTFWMEVGNREAESRISFESAVRCEHVDRRRLERVVVREAHLALVHAALVW